MNAHPRPKPRTSRFCRLVLGRPAGLKKWQNTTLQWVVQTTKMGVML